MEAPYKISDRRAIQIHSFLKKPLPHLQHLILDLGCLSGARCIYSSSHMPALESLTIIYTKDIWLWENMALLAKTQPRRLVLTSYTYVPVENVSSFIGAFSHRQGPLPCLELRDMDVKLDYHRYEKPPLPTPEEFSEDFRIAELKIANVSWYRHVSKRRKSERRGWCRTGWDLFGPICDAADVVRVSVRDGAERYKEDFFERPVRDLDIDGNSITGETDSDRSTTEDGIEYDSDSTNEDEDKNENGDKDEDEDEDEDNDEDGDGDGNGDRVVGEVAWSRADMALRRSYATASWSYRGD